eukprot:TRINITY_DN2317_c0_g1_i1.p1 TRINITY_DN2317_c0_g1~~TRINITY_DN2317_c0_g1_i1.p1  ORF type:complete len:283 (-),score=75.59 TRINITY_DN2317_c0_g1_i1:261-1109(-)
MEENKPVNIESSEGDKGKRRAEEGEEISTVIQSDSSAVERTSRKPFTALSQEDADLALARTLQEQERAYMLLRMTAESSDYETSGSGNYDNECYADDLGENPDEPDANSDGYIADDYVHELADDIDPSLYEDDEAYARALQDAEDREMTARMMAMAGIHDQDADSNENEGDDSTSQDAWQDVDPDNMVYEELLALGEVVGSQSKGLNADIISSLPAFKYEQQSSSQGSQEQCVICRLEYEGGDLMINLPCKHHYHSECIRDWLKINKVCPICNKEVLIDANK